MKIYQIGLTLALIFGLAIVASAKTTPQPLQTKPLQEITKVPFLEEELINASEKTG